MVAADHRRLRRRDARPHPASGEGALAAGRLCCSVVATWATISLLRLAAIRVLRSIFHRFTDAIFESVSGFTTTGATILSDVEVLTPAVQFWRCFTHWLGGLGIVLLGVAILPLVGHGGMYLYRAEFSGAKSEKLKPRITETALALWRIYFAMTALLYGLLRWAGMSHFDALCHTFSTLGTGGFSTRTASVAAFESPLIQYILIAFMLLAGISFIQHYRFFIEGKPGRVIRDIEIQTYLLLAVAASVLIAGVLIFPAGLRLRAGVPRRAVPSFRFDHYDDRLS